MHSVHEYRNDRWRNLGKLFYKWFHWIILSESLNFFFLEYYQSRNGHRVKVIYYNLFPGTLQARKVIRYASGLSSQNQLMIIGGDRDKDFYA